MDSQTQTRLAGERRAIRKLCQMARAKGWPPLAVDNMGEVIYTTSDREVLEHVFSVDESRIEFMGPEGKKAVALIVLGNSPSEVVADHSIRPGFSELMDEFFEWSEATLTD